jgi:hypothetical protein
VLYARASAATIIPLMTRRKLESRLVHYVMPEASETEIQQASERWFKFLNTLYEIVLEDEEVQHDSLGTAIDDIV